MDEFDFQGEELKATLQEIERINFRLGGNNVSLNGIKQLISNRQQKLYTVVDIGCGSGGFLKSLAKWARKQGVSVKLIGIDANPHTITLAKELHSRDEALISFQVMDVFSSDFSQIKADIITCNLTLHHFKDDKVALLLHQLANNATLGVVVNDLHRSALAYRLFQGYSTFFMKSKIAKHDGLISILRGFTKQELADFSAKLGPKFNCYIQWKWAFRWLWIIQNKKHE